MNRKVMHTRMNRFSGIGLQRVRELVFVDYDHPESALRLSRGAGILRELPAAGDGGGASGEWLADSQEHGRHCI
jgi:hypothetical protein